MLFRSWFPSHDIKIISKFIQARELDLLQEGDIVLSGYRLQKDCLILNEQQTKRFSISAKPASYYEHSDATCPKEKFADVSYTLEII